MAELRARSSERRSQTWWRTDGVRPGGTGQYLAAAVVARPVARTDVLGGGSTGDGAAFMRAGPIDRRERGVAGPGDQEQASLESTRAAPPTLANGVPVTVT